MSRKAKPLKAAPHRILGKFTPEQLARWKKAILEADLEKDELIAQAKKKLKETKHQRKKIDQVFTLLKAQREKQGLSLSDMSQRTGMAPEVISRLENHVTANPTITTIQRYAEALGFEVQLLLTSLS